MPSVLPDGELAPIDGTLPAHSIDQLGQNPFGFYVHVPFCTVRCGYCDFNTYTAIELGPVGGHPGASRQTYAEAAISEIRASRRVLGDRVIPVETIFFGGGTPTLLPAEDLVAIVAAIDEEFGIAPGAEITTEANPDSVTPESLATLRQGGFNRLSFGMQSAVPSVLATLDRTHNPANVPLAVAAARAAGFEQISLDLIYGTPGETIEDWQTSIDAALACKPDHISAYSLIVEDGTALARQVRRGEVPMPDEDDYADKYVMADEAFRAAGLSWYEVSNWSTSVETQCRHNVLYWTGADWWGVGPGAHSHVGGTRWWNVKHPVAYADRIGAGNSPAQAREVLTPSEQHDERVMLELRLARGLSLEALEHPERVDRLVADGLVIPDRDRIVLTDRGRLLADGVIRDLLV